jgi:hypothetical protein
MNSKGYNNTYDIIQEPHQDVHSGIEQSPTAVSHLDGGSYEILLNQNTTFRNTIRPAKKNAILNTIPIPMKEIDNETSGFLTYNADSMNAMIPDNICSTAPVSASVSAVPEYICSDDDGQSVSTLESSDDFPPKGHRPIFQDYWSIGDEKNLMSDNTQRCKQSGSTLETTASTISKSTYQTNSYNDFPYQEFNRDFYPKPSKSTDVYEQVLKEIEIGLTSTPDSTTLNDNDDNEHEYASTISSAKRSIFREKYSLSQTSLISYCYRQPSRMVQKASSTSSLLRNKRWQRSCLRGRSILVADSDAVGSLLSSSFSSKLSVKFDSKVSVHHYEKPFERHTTDGWSKYFVQ